MKCAWLCAALGAASWAGCGDPTNTGVAQLNLDRPVDIAFACYGAMRQTNGLPADPSQPVIATAQPRAACDSLSPPVSGTEKPVMGQETLLGTDGKPIGNPIAPDWYAFILQSASGTVAVAKWPVKPADTIAPGVSDLGGDFQVLDGDPLTPGKNAITIGEDPVAIATDRAGCFEITANAGSCDLSELDIKGVLDNINIALGTIPPVPGKPMTPTRVDRVQVTNANGQAILAKPAAMVAEPGAGPAEVGKACPMTATGKVFIAYPSCHLVAGVDTATGQIVSGIKYDATGAPTVLSGTDLAGVSCPAECTGGAATAAPGSITPGPQPVALDLRLDDRVNTSRLVIGTKNSTSPAKGQAASLTVVPLTLDTSDPDPGSLPFQIALEDPTADPAAVKRPSTLGVSSVALSPQIGMGGNAAESAVSDDTSLARQGQYVYAVATDGTVRVADVLNLKRECDTQIDGRFIHKLTNNHPGQMDDDVPTLQCFKVGDATLPRRSGVRGPGIELPGDAVPTSVAIVKGRSAPLLNTDTNDPLPASPTTLLGYFAIVTASNGAGYVVNIDDDYAPDLASNSARTSDQLNASPVLVMAHQLRDSFSNRGQGPETSDGTHLCQAADPLATHGGAIGGGPRLISPPAAAPPPGTITPANVLPLPTIREVACTLDQGAAGSVPVSELDFGAPDNVRNAVYPDLRSVTSETWTLTWEGTLSLDNFSTAVDGPVIRSGQVAVDGHGMTLNDPAHPFCEIGVEPFDVVDLRGCSPANGDGDCPAGYTCYVHPKSVGIGVGACMLKSEAPRLADACFEFLTTLRRYTVDHADTGQLTLLERKHELANTPIDGCVDDNQCNQLAQDALKIDPTADPFTAQTHWACQTDPLRAPINPDPAKNKRCVQTCSTDTAHPVNCANGTICRLLNPSDPSATDGICMEGVEPPQECVRGPQRYDVRASEAFTVIGSQSGYVHSITRDPADPTGVACTRPDPAPTARNVQVGRIPVNPAKVPACSDSADPLTGEITSQPGVFEPNPCSLSPLSVMQFDTNTQTDTAACAAAPKLAAQPQMRPARAIRFRNQAMTLTLVDPYQSCLPGGQGNPALVQLANRGYQIEFAQKAGFLPLQVPVITPTYPVKVVRGPSESFWVIDDGDFLSNTFTTASTRGRVFRVEGIDINVANTLE